MRIVALSSPVKSAYYGQDKREATHTIQQYALSKDIFRVSNKMLLHVPDSSVYEYKKLTIHLDNGVVHECKENEWIQLILTMEKKNTETTTTTTTDKEMISSVMQKHSRTVPMTYLQDRMDFKVHISPERRPTCNILMPGLSIHLTGGPWSIFEIAQKMMEKGIRVRIINVAPSKYKWSDVIPLLPYSQQGEWVDYENVNHITYSSSDVFMATLYWTAFLAHSMQQKLNQKSILYMIQDCESFFFPQNSESAYAYASYEIPHIPIFNSWVLEEYFQQNHMSVFGGTFQEPSFQFFPTYPSTAHRQKMEKGKKRLIVYSRPQTDRNAYDFTMSCVWEAVRQGLFPPEKWMIFGVGATAGTPNISGLGGGDVKMYNMDHMDQDKYKELITTGDIGLSLMLTPHPSLPPFDFAAAGMLVVTNELFHRTKNTYKSISQNFFPARLSILSIVESLRKALTKVDDYDFRIQGSFLNIPPHVIDYDYLKKHMEL